jgi:hypothetical protein
VKFDFGLRNNILEFAPSFVLFRKIIFFDKFVSKTQNNFSKQNEAWRKFQNIIS